MCAKLSKWIYAKGDRVLELDFSGASAPVEVERDGTTHEFHFPVPIEAQPYIGIHANPLSLCITSTISSAHAENVKYTVVGIVEQEDAHMSAAMLMSQQYKYRVKDPKKQFNPDVGAYALRLCRGDGALSIGCSVTIVGLATSLELNSQKAVVLRQIRMQDPSVEAYRVKIVGGGAKGRSVSIR